MATLNSFEELECWKSARGLRLLIKKLTLTFPPEERFRLGVQIIRSSRSVSANIAEGFGRFHNKENMRMCRIAKGSLSETLDHLIVAYDEEIVRKEDYLIAREVHSKTMGLLNGYINYLRSMPRTKD